MNLEELRREIDKIDTQIVSLISERMKTVKDIGLEKEKLGKQIEDAKREGTVLEHVKHIARKESINEEYIESIYKQIVTISRNMQGTMIAFQGELGAYGEEAALQFFGPSIHVKPCESLDDVFKIVEMGTSQFGVVPIENSLEGSISRVYDLLLDSNLKVYGETELKISHCLIANPGAQVGSINKVYSHPQALAQCRAFLKHLDCELIPTYNTAASVKMIKDKDIKDGAAVASARAADIYGMQIIATEIEDNPSNFTRFFILSTHDAPPTRNGKTSIVFSVKHKPGTLYAFLQTLASKKINLTKIESRPTRQKPWEYNFYLDFEGHREDKLSKEILDSLEQVSIFVKILGSYPKAK